jgi:DivIVA domain-containing protein
VELDRQSIERRDFPIGRRGYDPEAVDAHLRSLATKLEEQRRGGSGESLGASAGNQVQTILEAAESAASEIERAALENARQVREAAERDAEKTREDAVEKSRAHVAAVAQVTAGLVERVGSMDSEVTGLIESLRAGAGRLAADLTSVESGMRELYGSAAPAGAPSNSAAATSQAAPRFEQELDAAIATPSESAAATAAEADEASGAGSTDVDGARLIALNMALNGESRSDTERYLAENFELPDRLQLIDEVYAAIES